MNNFSETCAGIKKATKLLEILVAFYRQTYSIISQIKGQLFLLSA